MAKTILPCLLKHDILMILYIGEMRYKSLFKLYYYIWTYEIVFLKTKIEDRLCLKEVVKRVVGDFYAGNL